MALPRPRFDRACIDAIRRRTRSSQPSWASRRRNSGPTGTPRRTAILPRIRSLPEATRPRRVNSGVRHRHGPSFCPRGRVQALRQPGQPEDCGRERPGPPAQRFRTCHLHCGVRRTPRRRPGSCLAAGGAVMLRRLATQPVIDEARVVVTHDGPVAFDRLVAAMVATARTGVRRGASAVEILAVSGQFTSAEIIECLADVEAAIAAERCEAAPAYQGSE